MSETFNLTRAAAIGLVVAASLPVLGADQTVEVTAQALRPVPYSQAETARGVYQLADKRRLTLTPVGSTVRAELWDEPTYSLRAASPTELRSADGEMIVRLIADERGEFNDVVVTLVRGGQSTQLVAKRGR